MKTLQCLPLCLGLVALPSLALAQNAPAPAPSATPTPAIARVAPAPNAAPTPGMVETTTARDPSGSAVHRVEFIVYGERQVPYAFAVAGRSPLGYTYLDERRSFHPEVTEAVRRAPF